MWMGIKAWDHKKQTQKISPVILSKAKDPCNPNRMHCARKEFFLHSVLRRRTKTVNTDSQPKRPIPTILGNRHQIRR
jgi:hypothetical protein